MSPRAGGFFLLSPASPTTADMDTQNDTDEFTLDNLRGPATDFLSLLELEAPDFAFTMTEAEAREKCEEITGDFVLEEIARGSLPNELALRYGVPIMKFRKWMEDAVSPDELKIAMRLCAESNTLKSKMVLTQSTANARDASMIKEYSKRVNEIAEKIDPGTWSARHVDPDSGAGGQTINIVIGSGSSGVPLPGTEILGGSSPRQPPAALVDPLKMLKDAQENNDDG